MELWRQLAIGFSVVLLVLLLLGQFWSPVPVPDVPDTAPVSASLALEDSSQSRARMPLQSYVIQEDKFYNLQT